MNPDNPYQVDFARNKFNEPCYKIMRFNKAYVRGNGYPFEALKLLKTIFNHWLFDLGNQKKI